jgi:hypothetical protein
MPPKLESLAALAVQHADARRFREAIAVYRRIGKLTPGAPAPLYYEGVALWALGDIDGAVALMKRVVTTSFRQKALVQLAEIAPTALSAADRADIERGAANEADPAARADLAFAFAGLVEHEGDYDRAFAAFAAANRLKRELLGEAVASAIARRASVVAQAKTIFTPAFLAHHRGGGHPTAQPIFIVGAPRSGSTLVEQILASHPKVQGMGECPALDQVTRGRFPYPVTAPSGPDHFAGLASAYLAAMRGLGLKNTPRFVDKTLSNDAGFGLITLMFPRAVIIEVVRDPVETGLANFRRNFNSGNEDSYDLGDIGRGARTARALMDHWDAVLPGRVARVSYEALVGDPEVQMRRIVCEICDLEWDPACLRFHETRRTILTSSAVQVRQPLFSEGVARARHYKAHLAPLRQALGLERAPL